MTDFTTIPNSELAVDAPARSINALQLRDNPIAITEGATGAPRTQVEGLQANELLASVVYTAFDPDAGQNVTIPETVYSGGNGGRVNGAGTIRIRFQHLASSATVSSRVLKNGAQQVEFTTTSGTFVQREHDLAVVWGDVVLVQHKVTVANQAVYLDLTFTADNEFWVTTNASI
jgi:hypothetical protein